MTNTSQSKWLDHAPSGHPRIPEPQVGVLLLNLGTPDATDFRSMHRYLQEFLWDPRVIEPPPPRWLWWLILNGIILTRRPRTSGAAYRKIWNRERDESPLLTVTREQTDEVRAELESRFGNRLIVDFAMRYGNPSIPARLARMKEMGCTRVLCLALYPQYAAATTATAYDRVFQTLMEYRWQPAVRTAPPYHDHPAYVAALADSVRQHLATRESQPQVLVASFHGLPLRYFQAGDPYHCHCCKTARLLAETLGQDAPRIETTFQSRFGREEWLQPYTVERVAELARSGEQDIAVIAPGFSADCVETLEEIQEEIAEAFHEAGGNRFTYIPCLNSSDTHVRLIANMVENELQGWLEPGNGAGLQEPNR